MHDLLDLLTRQKLALDFPNLNHTAFLNTASLGVWPQSTKAEIERYIDEWNNLHDSTPEVFDAWRECKAEIASMVGSGPSEIGWAFNTSHGLNIAAAGLDFEKGDEIILSDVEFPANTYVWTKLIDMGIKIKWLSSKNRCFDIGSFEEAISEKTKLFSISFVQFFNGFRNDIKRLGEICASHNIFYVVDGIQGVSNTPLDVKDCRIDLLACGAQKWLSSPVGCGFFYLSDDAKLEVGRTLAGWFGVDWKADWSNLLRHNLMPDKSAERFGLSAPSYIHIYAMLNSLKKINEIGAEKIGSHNRGLLDQVIEYLNSQDYYRLASDLREDHRSSILSFTCTNPAELQKYLMEHDVITSYREGLIRVAVHYYNSEDHIAMLLDCLNDFKSRA